MLAGTCRLLHMSAMEIVTSHVTLTLHPIHSISVTCSIVWLSIYAFMQMTQQVFNTLLSCSLVIENKFYSTMLIKVKIHLPLKVELRKTRTVLEETGGRSPILPDKILLSCFVVGSDASSITSI